MQVASRKGRDHITEGLLLFSFNDKSTLDIFMASNMHVWMQHEGSCHTCCCVSAGCWCVSTGCRAGCDLVSVLAAALARLGAHAER